MGINTISFELCMGTYCPYAYSATCVSRKSLTFYLHCELYLSCPLIQCSIDIMRLGFLSPRLMSHVKYGTMCNFNVFPRRVRSTTPEGTDPIILQSYLSICRVRTRRLLASPDELRREVGYLVELKHSTLSYSVDVPPFAKRREG